MLHFLVAGILIFLAYAWLEEDTGVEQSGYRIHVDREALLNFMQYRAQAFDRDLFSERFDNLTDRQRQALIEEYVQEEALFREAIGLGLDEGDYDIRLRLIQKMKFLLEDVAAGKAEQIEPAPEDIRQYYETYKDEYRSEPVYTFTHVFFDSETRGDMQAREMAAGLLSHLRQNGVGVEDVVAQGDGFRYLRTYRARSRTQVVNNFGQEFVDDLDALSTQDPAWEGPFKSRYGWHLVYLSERTASVQPELSEIYQQVVDDYRYQRLAMALQIVQDELVQQYEVIVDLP